MKYDIFISYRRKGGAEKARPLKSELERRGYRVFLDFDELKDGVFDQRIMDAIDEAPIFLVILSAHSLDRCINEDDWVRKEIEYAVKKKRHFVPVNPDKEFEGFSVDTPESIRKGVGQHQFSHIDFEQLFKASIDKMVSERIEPLLEQMNRTSSSKGALVKIDSDLECRVLDFGEEIATLSKGMNEIRLPKGNHEIVFLGAESDAERFDYGELDVRDLEYVTRIRVRLLDQYNARKAEEERKRKAEEEAKRIAEEEARSKAEEEARRKRILEQERIEQEYRLSGKGRNGVYKVGDYYDDGKKKGVVFEVSADGKHGKIVSLAESEELSWAKNENFGTFFERDNPAKQFIGADDAYNGANNMAKVMQIADWHNKYPTFAWCADLGEGWYLPAIEELKKFTLDNAVHDALNRTLAVKGKELANKRELYIFRSYWSSTENYKWEESEFCAWRVYMYDSYASSTFKSYYIFVRVRAVSVF